MLIIYEIDLIRKAKIYGIGKCHKNPVLDFEEI